MDVPLERPRNRGWRKYRSHLILSVIVIGVVFAVASIVPLFLYVMAPADVRRPDSLPTDGLEGQAFAPPAARPVLFRHVRIVNTSGGGLEGPTDVLVAHGRVSQLGHEISPPRDAILVDAAGKYLMPGLIDTHVHLTDDRQLLLFLASGVTTVQSLGGPVADNVGRRSRIEEGKLAGPEVVSCDVVARGPVGDVAALVADALSAGVGCIKIYSPPDWTSAEHAALIEAAERQGLRAGGHLARNLPLEEALAHGQQFVAHAEEFLYTHFFKSRDRLNAARIPEVVALSKQAGISVTATLVAYHAIVEQVGPGIERLMGMPELKYVPADIRERWTPGNNRYRQRFTPEDGSRLRDAYEFQRTFVAAFAAAGIPIAVGTDASPSMPFVIPGFSALDELDELAAAGLPPAAVLAAATVNGARQLRRSDIGTLTPGARADLLLLDANPLEDVKNVRRLAGVIANGRWMDARWIEEALKQLER
jgi:imidazolonepropionase-like amidohydrolase